MFEIFVLNEWENKAFRSATVPLFNSSICSATNNIMFILIICFFIQRDLSRVNNGMVAPISNLTPGLQRAQVTHGIREVSLFRKKYATERLQLFLLHLALSMTQASIQVCNMFHIMHIDSLSFLYKVYRIDYVVITLKVSRRLEWK